MQTQRIRWGRVLSGLLVLAACVGCGSTDGGGSSVSGSVYYGVGVYDPWYHGGYWYDDPDIIVTPPPRPSEPPPRPTHPIAPAPAPRPMPSIPSTPRPSFRR
jgi:hypothetical protein